MNNPMVLFQAGQFAARVRAEVGESVGAQVDRAMLLALGRLPDEFERARAIEFTGPPSASARPPGAGGVDGLVEFCHILFNLNEFLFRQ
jgi:hypothetical protein